MSAEIDGILASIKETEKPVTQEPEKVVESAETADVQETETDAPENAETETAETKEPDDTPFPKKAVNAISRRDKIIAKERAEKAAILAELERYRSQGQAQTTKPEQSATNTKAPPNEDDFDNYGDYLKAQVLHEVEQKQAQKQADYEAQQRQAQYQEWEAQQTARIAQAAQSHSQSIPDFASVIDEHADIMDELPQHVQTAFLEAEDGALAFYVLAKDGKLDDLVNMTPYQVMREIVKAESRKPSLNRVTKAPEPIKGVQGRGSVTKDLSELSGSELLKRLNIKY